MNAAIASGPRPCDAGSFTTSSPPRARARGTRACAARAGRGRSAPARPPRECTPLSRKQTLSATSRANPISCVAMIIVMPDVGELADETQHVGHELRVERARDLVEQHQLRLHRECAHDRHALLLPAAQPVGILVGLLLEPDASEQLACAALRVVARDAARLARREHHVLQHRHVRKEVVRLEDDADLLAQRVHVDLVVRDPLPVDDDLSFLDALEHVEAAQQRRLARARRADQADDVVLDDVERDLLQHLQVAEPLRDGLHLHEGRCGVAVAAQKACARSRRSRCATR